MCHFPSHNKIELDTFNDHLPSTSEFVVTSRKMYQLPSESLNFVVLTEQNIFLNLCFIFTVTGQIRKLLSRVVGLLSVSSHWDFSP